MKRQNYHRSEAEAMTESYLPLPKWNIVPHVNSKKEESQIQIFDVRTKPEVVPYNQISEGYIRLSGKDYMFNKLAGLRLTVKPVESTFNGESSFIQTSGKTYHFL